MLLKVLHRFVELLLKFDWPTGAHYLHSCLFLDSHNKKSASFLSALYHDYFLIAIYLKHTDYYDFRNSWMEKIYGKVTYFSPSVSFRMFSTSLETLIPSRFARSLRSAMILLLRVTERTSLLLIYSPPYVIYYNTKRYEFQRTVFVYLVLFLVQS